MLHRRNSASPALPKQVDTGVGELLMRRVEFKGRPRNPFWYFETLTDHDAIHKLCNNFKPRLNPETLHVTHRYSRG